MSEVVSVRFSPDEMIELREQAEQHNRSLSKHIRELALVGMRRNRPGVETRVMPSGAEITTFAAGSTATQGVA